MCSLTGITYMNVIDRASNTLELLWFFQEAYTSANPATGRPCLEVGDTIVMDNCPILHYLFSASLPVFIRKCLIIPVPCFVLAKPFGIWPTTFPSFTTAIAFLSCSFCGSCFKFRTSPNLICQ